MKQFHYIVLFVGLAVVIKTTSSQEDYNILPPFLHSVTRRQFIQFRQILFNLVGRTASIPRHLQEAEALKKIQKRIPDWKKFPCDVSKSKSSTVPTSVHQLRPGDIKVVGALGDSLTAGFGATASNVLEVLAENRGLSWSIGGQGTWRQYLTLPNILKEFNPDLIGYSLGDSFTFQNDSQFNVAEGGAMTVDMPFMARELIKRIKHNPKVDVQNDWKIITILIGSNDYCLDMCYIDSKQIVSMHRNYLIETLQLLKDNLPRTLVNLVISPNVAVILTNLKLQHRPLCWFTHHFECPCILGSRFVKNLKYYNYLIEQCQQVEFDISNDPRFQTNDFAVVAQPFTYKISIPMVREGNERLSDASLFSQDCFHFSQRGYARGSNALWNNMLQPVGHKTTNWKREFTEFLCPTDEHPYIFTNFNSGNLTLATWKKQSYNLKNKQSSKATLNSLL